MSRAVLVVFGLVAGLVAGEIALRLLGFSFRTYPSVQFGWPEPSVIRDLYDPDPDLFWVTHDYFAALENARRARPAIVFMGDSCTQFGSYPTITLARLSVREPSLATGIKVGVAGWSSEQGLAQLRRDIIPLRPSVVTVYYGWNDHWIALGPPDAEAHATALAWWLAQHVRLWQLLTKVRLAASPGPAGRPERVGLDRYVANLETIVRLANAAGIRTVLITAPSGHDRGHEPEYLARRHLRRLDELVPLHERYVGATRRAARETGAVLCDAAAAFDVDSARASYFEKDGIHLTKPGNNALATLLVPCVIQAAGQSSLRAER